MKHLFVLIGLFLTASVFAQSDVERLVAEGTQLHDQGKYSDAIIKYKEALSIDKNSTVANYELSYTYMTMENYADAIIYSKKVIDQKSDNLAPAYCVLGTSLDMQGNPAEAIKAYEKGLKKFPKDDMLNYNLALTTFKTGDYVKAEKAAINSIMARPTHGSSHLVLANVMSAKNERVKAVLPLYYFLLLEPNSKRSLVNLEFLKKLLGQGVEKSGEKNININVPESKNESKEWMVGELTIGMLAATKYTAENEGKTENQIFVENTKSLFSVLDESRKKNTGLWWDLYVNRFGNLVKSNNVEAFGYYILQSSNSSEVDKWIQDNLDKMKQFLEWRGKVTN